MVSIHFFNHWIHIFPPPSTTRSCPWTAVAIRSSGAAAPRRRLSRPSCGAAARSPRRPVAWRCSSSSAAVGTRHPGAKTKHKNHSLGLFGRLFFLFCLLNLNLDTYVSFVLGLASWVVQVDGILFRHQFLRQKSLVQVSTAGREQVGGFPGGKFLWVLSWMAASAVFIDTISALSRFCGSSWFVTFNHCPMLESLLCDSTCFHRFLGWRGIAWKSCVPARSWWWQAPVFLFVSPPKAEVIPYLIHVITSINYMFWYGYNFNKQWLLQYLIYKCNIWFIWFTILFINN